MPIGQPSEQMTDRPPSKRLPSIMGEIERGARAAQERRTPARGVEVFEGEDVTGNYEGEALQEMRRRRDTGERVDRMEVKHDRLVDIVTEMRVEHGEAIARVETKLEDLPKLVDIVTKIADRAGERDHVTFTAKMDVDTAKQIDGVKAGASHREWVTSGLKILGAAVAIASAAFAAGRC